MSRLRWKLLVAMMALVTVTIGVSALFARRVTHDSVRRLVVERRTASPTEIVRPLEEHVRATGGWRDVDGVIDGITAVSPVRIVLTTMGGDILGVSADLRAARVSVTGNRLTIEELQDQMTVELAPIEVHGPSRTAIARVFVLDAAPPVEPVEREIAAIDRGLLAVFALATLIALILSFVISRRVTRPIEQLTGAVREMEHGRVPSRVEVTGRDEVARLAASFNAMVDAVAKQEELRRRMVADVAHELRTPLTNLRCELEAIQDGLATPDAARVGSLHEEVLHLQRLVEDLQELAAADAGALRLHEERIDLAAAAARIVGAQAELTTEPGLIVNADVTRLRQVLQNVLANAVRHGGGGILVRVTRAGSDAAISVTDHGPGIAANDLDRIFERFYRVDEVRGRSGAGLGLAIVRRLVELHGGKVWAESVVGEGTTVTFTIPLASS